MQPKVLKELKIYQTMATMIRVYTHIHRQYKQRGTTNLNHHSKLGTLYNAEQYREIS